MSNNSIFTKNFWPTNFHLITQFYVPFGNVLTKHKHFLFRARRRKKLRILMSQIYEVKRIKREIKERDAALEERRKYRKEKGEKRMPRLGQIKYKEPEQDLKLSTELTGTLRQLVPEGHVLTDRLQVNLTHKFRPPRSV